MNAWDIHNYGDKINNIFNEYHDKLVKRIEGDDTAYMLGTDFIKFVDSDPSENKIYVRWIVDSYVNGGIRLIEDLGSRVKPALEDYIILKPNLTGQEKIIDNYCGIAGRTKKFKEKPGLETLLDKYRDLWESKRAKVEAKEQVKEDTEVAYEDDEMTIYYPKTEAAACHY